MTACYAPPGVLITEGMILKYTLEVVNEANEPASVRLGIRGDGFRVRWDGPGFEYRSTSDLIHLDTKESRTFAMLYSSDGLDPDSAADNFLIREFFQIQFFREDTDRPYKVYGYAHSRCPGGEYRCDDEMLVYGSRQRLFVESPTRPFYLERDEDDLDLARIVITFVPSPESGAVSAVDTSLK